ncbi:MAG: GIY-YIG nuclease family protein [Sphingomonadaceae bacterium]
MEKQGFVYIMASGRHGTTYVGVTSDLTQRIYQHREGILGGFTSRHNITRLVWYDVFDRVTDAIVREKQIKKWNRDWKIRLIEETNPDWSDLAIVFGFESLSKR